MKDELNVGNEAITENVESNSEVGTTTTQTDEGNTTVKVEEAQVQTTEKTYTQEQINSMVRERLDKDRLSLYKRYGVEDKTGLDNLIGKAISFDALKEKYDATREEATRVANELTFVRKNINPERKDDIMAHFKGKGIEFNEEALEKELATHPEWLNVVKQDDTPKTTLQLVSPERGAVVQETEKEKAMKLFGLSKII